MRFGRDGNGAVVYVHTDTLPEWVPIAGEGGVVSTWSDGMKEVVRAASELGSWRTSDLVDHPDVTIGERQVREHLHALAEQGVVDVSVEGRGYVWRDDGLHRVGEHGDVELEPVDLEALDADEVAELERTTTTYTWEFRNSGDDPPVEAETTAGTGGEAASPVADAPSPPGDHPPQGG
jgi:DNA-binding transcriptional ArsR family regulator